MLIPKAKNPPAQSSRSRKRAKQSRRIVTTRTASEHSRKTKSNPSPARANILPQPDCPSRVAEPLNGVLLVGHDSHPVRNSMGADVFRVWTQMNLILSVDYGRNSFNVIKNRWGPLAVDLPLDLLGTFLFHPDVIDAMELYWLRIDHNNLFATREPEQ